jgi:hypothetical protein
MQMSPPDKITPCVGIFWIVPDENDQAFLIFERTPLDRATPYGDFLTHDGGHYEYWTELAALGPEGLRRLGLPTAPTSHEYEEFPRGRVVYHVPDERFTVYLDRKLFVPDYVEMIVVAFDLPRGRYDLRSDPHY